MDIYCPKRGCSEPVEQDFFHDVPGMTYVEASRAFQSKGCEGIGLTHSQGNDSFRSEAMSAVFELLGDDIDGAASLMEDFEFFGMLD